LRHGNNVIEEDRKRLREYRFHATIDAVTGLFNRHWLRKMLPRQMVRSSRCSEPLTILMIDIDHFKQFNDRYGHVAGDCALKLVADCLRDTVRPTDMVTRYGGEEFLVLLPSASAENGLRIGERLRRVINAKTVTSADGVELAGVTISIGVAQMPEDSTPEAFIDAADAALYRAKLGGRDQVSE
jgi:diguanylate cyclase (GGDEF)-like protein